MASKHKEENFTINEGFYRTSSGNNINIDDDKPKLIRWYRYRTDEYTMHVIIPGKKRKYWFDKKPKILIVVGVGVYWATATVIKYSHTLSVGNQITDANLIITLSTLWKTIEQKK